MDKITVYRKAAGWRWRLQSPNNRIIGVSSEAFSSRIRCVQNCERVTGTHPRQWIADEIPKVGGFTAFLDR